MIGQVGRAHGVRGEVRVRATGPTLPTVEPGEELILRGRDGREERRRIAAVRGEGDSPIVAFEGVEDRDGAAALAGARILVPAARVPPPPGEDTFYVRDLIGCRVRIGGRDAGAVTEVHPAPANDVIEVLGDEGPLLVPFTGDAVVSVDLTARVIVVRDDLFPPGT